MELRHRPIRKLLFTASTVALFGLGACGQDQSSGGSASHTPEQAKTFVDDTSKELRGLFETSAQASWAKATNITEETIKNEAAASAKVLMAVSTASRAAAAYNDVDADYDTRRQLDILKTGSTAPAPADEAKTKELADIMSRMEAIYGAGKYCEGSKCLTLDELSDILADSHDYDDLSKAWVGWHQVGQDLKPLYARFVELVNQGAKELGYDDVGALWRSQYEMTPEAFAQEVDRLWNDVAPLYNELHCHVRAKLGEQYGTQKVPQDGRIPAHLLGNMWSQTWGNIYPLVTPYPEAPSNDVTEELKRQNYDALKMVKLGENFFSSLGFEPLPQTFWERSMFVKPEGREVVCHASAWNLDFGDDIRIKMCTKINEEDLITIHHELGHNYYQRAYNKLPLLYQDGANDGFHEAIGDAIALSITPNYLRSVGLMKTYKMSPEVAEQAVINEQMRMALDKIAFLPFGRLMDAWRWDVFAGKINPETYNAGWWELRRRYQGIEPPVDRTEADFDAGAKYHIPSNTPYMRYFLSFILQFQFYKGLCDAAGHQGPLYTCSFYDSKEAGAKFSAMMEMGKSRPWPEALEAVTGTQKMDSTALVEYFTPLLGWLKEQNKGRQCGWPAS